VADSGAGARVRQRTVQPDATPLAHRGLTKRGFGRHRRTAQIELVAAGGRLPVEGHRQMTGDVRQQGGLRRLQHDVVFDILSVHNGHHHPQRLALQFVRRYLWCVGV
jgi:hypothetical protein